MKLTRSVLLVILSAALFVQLVIISYNQATGFIRISGLAEFAVRLSFGSTLSFAFGVLLFLADERLIRLLDRRFAWETRPAARLAATLLAVAAIGWLLGTAITAVAHAVSPYSDGFPRNAVNNALITMVINLIVAAVIEAVLWYRRGREAARDAAALEQENLRLRFETLKQQLNPHFLFNALNTLSSLIGRDDMRAQAFVDDFSAVYGYTLDVLERPAVTLREELDFARDYVALQQVRFSDGVRTEIDIDSRLLDRLVPPLAVQTLLENALKHNSATPERPLRLTLRTVDGTLEVANNLQPRHEHSIGRGGARGGIGLENLRRRYALISGSEPVISLTGDRFVASLPLIEAQQP